jgi:crotonobetainyl-CoA:carnitine CoA-transferase CaiB-like acyl-CoA transferase
MTIAGGIMGALFHRERTGEATIVDVSLLGVGMWAMGQAMALSLVLDTPWTPPPADRIGSNPLSRNYETKDGRTLAFTCLQPAKYWPPMCEVIGRPELIEDPLFADYQSLMANSDAAVEILTEVFGSATLADWRVRLDSFSGQWAVVQDTLEAASDPQSVANGYIQECETATPVQFDEEPASPRRAPEFNEHGEKILAGIGLDDDAIIDLKIRGVVA